MESFKKKIENTLVPSLFAAGVGAGAYYFMYGSQEIESVPLGPLNVSLPIAVGGTVFIGNVAGEILTQFILPMLPEDEQFKKIQEMVVPPAITGLSTFLSMRILVSENTELLPAILLGGGSSIGGKYIYGYTMGV